MLEEGGVSPRSFLEGGVCQCCIIRNEAATVETRCCHSQRTADSIRHNPALQSRPHSSERGAKSRKTCGGPSNEDMQGRSEGLARHKSARGTEKFRCFVAAMKSRLANAIQRLAHDTSVDSVWQKGAVNRKRSAAVCSEGTYVELNFVRRA